TSAELGLGVGLLSLADADSERGRVVIVEDHLRSAARMLDALGDGYTALIQSDPQAALLHVADQGCDVLVVSLNLANADGLRLGSQVRSVDRTRHLPIIIVIQPGDEARLMRALDMGVNDYLMRPLERNEMLARVRTQVRRKRHADLLRARLDESVELAITDAL